jgi:hypothetical protein
MGWMTSAKMRVFIEIRAGYFCCFAYTQIGGIKHDMREEMMLDLLGNAVRSGGKSR